MPKKNRYANDLFLLMLNLAQLSSRDKIINVFLEATSEIWPNITPEFSTSDNKINSIEITTTGSHFGYVNIEYFTELDSEDQDLLHNACGMLAVILKTKEHEELIADEKLHLEKLVEERTRYLKNEIQERKRVEQALRESEDKFRHVFNHATIGKSLTYPTGEMEVNKSFHDMLGYSAEEFHTLSWQQITHPDDIETSQREVDSLLSGEKNSTRITKRFLHKDGSVVWADVSTSARRDQEDRIIYFMTTISNITEHKRAEEERDKLQAQLIHNQKIESVGRLAGGVAHDYNNSLSVIFGFTEMAMQDVDPSGEIYANLAEVLSAAKRSANITRQLLAFARQQTIAPKVLNLNHIIDNMVKMLQRLIGEDIDFAWIPGDALWPVKIDPTQIDQILANLCVNARDAISDVGKITIETKNMSFDKNYCAVHAEFIPGDYIMLAVSDNGKGMNSEVLDKIFEPFFTTKDLHQGTGLGLATVYGIVKQNNALINVYSEVDDGTTFKIYLPRHTKLTKETYHEPVVEIPLSRGETVLLVEDDQSILALGKRILEDLGYTTLVANSPHKAIKIAETFDGNIDLLLTDVVMPEMNGRELSEQLKNHYPELRILFMSGYTANVIAHHGVLEEGVYFMPKPFSKKNLAVKVREALDNSNV